MEGDNNELDNIKKSRTLLKSKITQCYNLLKVGVKQDNIDIETITDWTEKPIDLDDKLSQESTTYFDKLKEMVNWLIKPKISSIYHQQYHNGQWTISTIFINTKI